MHPTQNNDNSGTSLGQADSTEQQAAQSQTDSTNAQHQDSQTDKVESQDSDMQTKDPDTQSSAMQTQAKDESQAEQQTEKVVLADGESQTFHAVRIIQPTEDAESQAGVYSDVHCDAQTTMSYSNMVEGLSQTELEQASIDVQTEALVTVDQYIQIQPEQAEVICQTVKDEAEAGCQVEPEATESIIQTDFSLANLVDGSAQAVVDVAYQECQATVESSSNEAQTDMSMALQADSEAQATVDVSEQIIQTDVKEIVDTHAQTELETGEQFCQTEVLVDSKDSQTEYVVVEVETQTEIEEALPIITNDPTEVVVQETSQVTVESSQVSSIDEIPDIASSGISNSQNSILDANNPHVMQIVPEVSEEGCQTDPVTIIIGDASFLVKKLKGSSLSPTKVSSMGNEIEIELRADDEEATPYDLPEKENAVAPLPTPPTRIRGNSNPYRARGPRTRGGAVFQRGAIRANQAQYVHRSQVGYQGNPGGAQYYASSAGVLGKYSCPVCSETFHESPALYEHLQHQHAEAFSLIKKPKGREGKTIQCKVSPEPEPPVLMPMEPISKKDTALQLQQQQLQQQQLQQQLQLQQQQQQQQQHIQHVVLQPQQTVEHVEVVQSTSQPQIVIQQHQETVIQEPVPQEEDDSQTGELFEDPSAWQSPNKTRKRTLARRQITDEEAVVEEAPGEEIHIVIQPSEETITEPAVEEQDQVGVVVGKRKLIVDHSSGEPVVKRIKIDEPPMITEVEPEPEPEPEEEETPRRRSRASLRAVKAAAEAATPAPEEVKSPRTRGRPKTVKK